MIGRFRPSQCGRYPLGTVSLPPDKMAVESQGTRGYARLMAFGEANGLLKLVCSRHARGGFDRGRCRMARAGTLVLSQVLTT